MGKIIAFLNRYCFRSSEQIWIHLAFSIALALVIYFIGAGNLPLKQQGFLPIISAIGAVSGALLAVLIAISTFYARYVTDWRDRLILRLENEEAKLRKQIETSAAHYPEISRRLCRIYDVVNRYRPGEQIDMDNVKQTADIFQDWAQLEFKKGCQIDFGNIQHLSSFQMHLRDANNSVGKVVLQFWFLRASHDFISGISTIPGLITGCAITVILSLGLAVMGAGGLIPEPLYLPFLVIPFWLTIVVVIGCTSDFITMLDIVQVQENTFKEAHDYLQNLKDKSSN